MDLDFLPEGDDISQDDKAQREEFTETSDRNLWRTLRAVATTNLNKFEKLDDISRIDQWVTDGGAEHGPADNSEAQDEGVKGEEGMDSTSNEVATNEPTESNPPESGATAMAETS